MNTLYQTARWSGLALAALWLSAGSPAEAAKNQPDSAMKDPVALARLIDQGIKERLAAQKVPASERSSDAEFLRRVYLDLVGVIPTAEKAAAFIDSKDPEKRAKLIDELLADPRYGKHMADIWQLMMLPRESNNRRLNHQPLIEWLADNFNNNKPWNQMVHDLLTASGPQNKNAAVTYFLANPTPDKINDSVCQLFLGIRLQCAQCHNHPFTDYKQDEYWAMAAFFFKVRPDRVNGRNATPGVTEETRQTRPRGLPEEAKIVPAKFLRGEQPKLDVADPYRPVLADWMTAAENPYFGRAMANRMWAHFFGKGFVEPVDDMHDDNPASHPELLQGITQHFIASGFDLKHLIRGMCLSETYQRTSKPASDIIEEKPLFSHMTVKPMTGEQLYDSLQVAAGSSDRPQNQRARGPQRRGGQSARDQFAAFFRADEGADTTEYQAGIPQALRLMNSGQFTNAAGRINTLARSAKSPGEVIEQLYLGTLSRRPTAQELQKLTSYVEANGASAAYNDIFWAILNSSEFTLNH